MRKVFLIILIILVGWAILRFVVGGSNEEIYIIASNSKECSMAGILTDNYFYNENSKTWWIDLERMPELENDGCNPACVVSEETKTAEVNWRCTGAQPE